MNRFLLILVVLILKVFDLNAQHPSTVKERKFRLPEGVTKKDYLPNRIVIKFKAMPAMPKQSKAAQVTSPSLKLESAKIASLKSKFPPKTNGLATTFSKQGDLIGMSRIFELRLEGETDVEQIINELLRDENVEYAEPIYVYRSNFTPNDPYYLSNNQSYLEQIKAPQAWDLKRDASDIIIAIVDSGSDLDHPDLASNIYINSRDPVNGVDDDNDGYTDNFAGWDFVGFSGIQPEEDNDPNVKSDSTDHGVHVSGIASAVSDNNIGVAGVASNAKLMIIKASADNDASTIYAGYEGIKYAADHGAHIINCSWGGPAGGAFGQDVINYAISKGCLIVAAAGNNGDSFPDFPAGYKGVLAVANVRNNDVKSGSSNYGTYVSISAPGTGILSLGYNNGYKSYSGTSMATPMVAGAAALVKSMFPELSMEEVGQRLRATADNINHLNLPYVGKLGGRLNVFRALSEAPPSIRNERLTVEESNRRRFSGTDTLDLYFDLKNYLSAASEVKVSLASTNSSVSILTNELNSGSFASGETKYRVGPFKVYVKPNTADNTSVEFQLKYTSGSYNDSETFRIVVALDYLNYQVNQIATTLTGNGRIGYRGKDAELGQGFVYKDQSLLYEASLMIGNSSTRVSNNTRTANSGSSEDFVKKVKVKSTADSPSEFTGQSEFDDSGSILPLNIHVKHKHIASAQSPDDKYVITEYKLINKNKTPLNDVYVALFTDWDIDEGSNNATEYDPVNRLAYSYAKASGSVFAGVKLLSNIAPDIYYPLSYSMPGDPLENGSFTISEKFQTLSSGVKRLGIGNGLAEGVDVMHVSGVGPIDIPPGDSAKVAFALIAGDNLDDLKNSAFAAQKKYALLSAAEPRLVGKSLSIKTFPNPAAESATVEFSLPEQGSVSLSLYNLQGRKVKEILSKKNFEGGLHYEPIDLQDLDKGIYICKMIVDDRVEKSVKISVLK